jgi:type IV pilus assembly protein PilB
VAPNPRTRIAVVVSDPDLRDELVGTFEGDYEVVSSLGDPGTIRMLREATPGAIVLDLDLDTFDAFELLRLIGGSPELRSAPLVAISSRNDFETFEKANRLGATEFVTKPLRPEDLRAKLEAAGAGRKQRSAGRLKLGALLVASGLLTQVQLDQALVHQRADGGRLGEVLVREGIVAEQDLVTALAGQMRIGVADGAQMTPEAKAMGLLPRDFIVRHRLMPLRVDDNGNLILAMTNPLDVIAIDEVSMRTGKRVIPVICTESGFDEAVGTYFSMRGKLRDSREEGAEEGENGGASVVDANIVEMVDQLLADATAMDASDIHLEPREDSLLVRCRIDGVLHELRDFPKDLQAGLTSRLKIMGNMNIAERRLPQDGRTSFELSSGEAVDVRMASIPSLYGENITLRILEVSPLPPTLASLGLGESTMARYEQALKAPEGGIVICGPTGSGKSTTLYTTLELIKSPDRKIYTVEDPIERKIEGIVQTEVKPLIGLTFAQSLRALVRADPDVIMVGEIRDLETAKMAADASITGHLVFSTLHTNDASAAVNRLVEMGVPRYLVAAAWRCFVAQRLVRRLCRHCRESEMITGARWEELGLGPAPRQKVKVYNPVGCPKCFGTGYRGRVGLYEVLVVDNDLRELIATGGTVLDVQRLARDKGVETLRDDAVRKVLDGSTSYLELLRATVV